MFRGSMIFKPEDHHLTAQSLAQAIRQGCYICNSTFQQYQGDKASTLGPSQFGEGFEGTKYYFQARDGPPYISLNLLWYGPDLKIYNLRYD